MPVTLDEILLKLKNRNFPYKLIESGFSDIMDAALESIGEYTPVTTFASFDTVAGQQDYAIFDPDDPVLAGFAANATAIKDVLWNPAGDFTSLNIFSPGWFTMSQALMFTGGYFHQPSQMMIIRQKLEAWRTQFGTQGYDIVGAIGEPASLLRLFPAPDVSGSKVIVEFESAPSVETVGRTQMGPLMDWVCYYAAEAIANKYATTAGIELLGFVDSTSAMKYWQGRAEWYHEHCMTLQGGSHGEVERS